MAWESNTGPAGTLPPLPDDDVSETRRARPHEAGRVCPLCGKRVYAGQLVQGFGFNLVRHAHCAAGLTAAALEASRQVGPPVTVSGLRVAVTGGRDFANAHTINHCLALLHDNYGIGVLAHGGAQGADLLAGRWARAHDVAVRVYEADWHSLGPRAGPERNRRMLAHFHPDLVVAFRGASGTADCLRAASEKEIPRWLTWMDKTPPPIPAATGSSVTGPTC